MLNKSLFLFTHCFLPMKYSNSYIFKKEETLAQVSRSAQGVSPFLLFSISLYSCHRPEGSRPSLGQTETTAEFRFPDNIYCQNTEICNPTS